MPVPFGPRQFVRDGHELAANVGQSRRPGAKRLAVLLPKGLSPISTVPGRRSNDAALVGDDFSVVRQRPGRDQLNAAFEFVLPRFLSSVASVRPGPRPIELVDGYVPGLRIRIYWHESVVP